MKSLLKIMLTFALVFATTFVVAKMTGLLSVDHIKSWLNAASEVNAYYIALIVIVLLFADIIIAVPTLTIIILSGYFLGVFYGSIASIIGVSLAGGVGYWLSYFYGEKLGKKIIKDPLQWQDAKNTFNQYGLFMILFSRAMPIFPEVAACMSGMTKMPLTKFATAWAASSIPYVLIASYAGSISTLDNPKPAIFTAIGLSLFFWTAWYVFRRLTTVKNSEYS